MATVLEQSRSTTADVASHRASVPQPATHRRPLWSARIPTSEAVGAIATWVVLYTLAVLVEPAGAPEPPAVLTAVLAVAGYSLLAAVGGFAARRRWAYGASLLASGLMLSGATWCITHLGIGLAFGVQAAAATALTAMGVAGLARR